MCIVHKITFLSNSIKIGIEKFSSYNNNKWQVVPFIVIILNELRWFNYGNNEYIIT